MTTGISNANATGVALAVATVQVDPRQLPVGQAATATGTITLDTIVTSPAGACLPTAPS